MSILSPIEECEFLDSLVRHIQDRCPELNINNWTESEAFELNTGVLELFDMIQTRQKEIKRS